MATSQEAPALSQPQLASLTHYSTLLHLLHHRSSRQHRRSPWYRHFSRFRRSLATLCTLYTTLFSESPTHKLRLTFPALRLHISQTLNFWQEILVPKWSWSFSQVVADGRFAVLGLVLIGCLSGACAVLGVTGVLEEQGQAEVERVLEEFGREAWGNGDGGLVLAEDGGEAIGGEDVGVAMARNGGRLEDAGRQVSRAEFEGEAVKREPESTDLDEQLGHEARAQSPRTGMEKLPKRKAADTKPKTTKKKRKKNGDAIDDLFGGL